MAIYIVTQFITEAEMTCRTLVLAVPVLLAREYGYRPEGVATMPPQYDEVVKEKQ